MITKSPLSLTAYTLVNALGQGCEAVFTALQQGRSGLRRCDFEPAELDTWIGRVDGVEDYPVPKALAEYDCRNNRLAEMGLNQDGFRQQVEASIKRYGAHRVGLFLGTSTSGIAETEVAYRYRLSDDASLPSDYRFSTTHNPYALSDFCCRSLGLTGPATVVSTACSSSAKVFAAAYRHIQAGFCDAAVVGGVDSLCLSTLYGFNSLDLLSSEPCRPWDQQRAGISIGEGAGFVLLEPHTEGSSELALLGYGESSDGYHMSTPHPQGRGAVLAMQRALQSAGLSPQQVDYLNLHGTATAANDSAEDMAVSMLFGSELMCSSTKGWTGHTLGAAGITEAIICCLALERDFVPATLNLEQPDPAFNTQVLRESKNRTIQTALSNSFGFGGNNCSLVFGRIS